MDYRKIGDNYYIRMDRGDEIITNLLKICEQESIPSAVFSGIGGCQSAELQVFIPEKGCFETEHLEGMLELVSINGNVVRDGEGQLFHHTHALFSFKQKIGGDAAASAHPDGRQTVAGGTPQSYHRALYRGDRIAAYSGRRHQTEIRPGDRYWLLGFLAIVRLVELPFIFRLYEQQDSDKRRPALSGSLPRHPARGHPHAVGSISTRDGLSSPD